jgi:hypothetical protein
VKKARAREEQVWEANVSDTPVDTTGPARKRYFSLPVSSHESVDTLDTHGRISSVLVASVFRVHLHPASPAPTELPPLCWNLKTSCHDVVRLSAPRERMETAA